MNKEYYIKLQAKIDDSSKTITELNKQIKTLEGQISELKLKVDSQKVSTANEQLKAINNTAKEGAQQANKWQYSWSKAFQSFTTYMSVTTVFYQTVNTIKDMIQEVTDLDSALTELRKVTDLEGASLQNFTQDAYDTAGSVAKTGTEMVQAATEFAKAGYDKSQILKLGELALMYTNIADEEVSAAEASEFMIAQMKAFNIEADDAIHIIDAVNEVANRYAVSSADIANNLGKSSAVMANAGNSYEQMIGLLTAGTEITRNASKVSNGLKTITLRLQGMDDEGEENLQLVAQMEALYKKLGISVYNSNGEMKNTYELLETLAPIYQEATAAEKAYITETIAGKYQAQNAAAILNNFGTAISATETALNSQGSAMAENEKVLGGIEGKLRQLNSQFEELSQKVMGSDLVKFFLDLGNILLKIANSGFGSVVGRIGLTLSSTILLTNGLKKLKTTIIDLINKLALYDLKLKGINISNIKIAASSSTLNSNLKLVKTNSMVAAVGLNAVGSSSKLLGLSFNAVTASIKAMGKAMLSNPIFWGVVAIQGVMALVDWIGKLQNNTDKLYDEAKTSYNNVVSELDSVDSKLSSISSRIDELKNKGSLSFTEKSELDNLKEQTKELLLQKKILEEKEEKEKKKLEKAAQAKVDKALNARTSYKTNKEQVIDTTFIEKFLQRFPKSKDFNGLNSLTDFSANIKDVDNYIAALERLKQQYSGNQLVLEMINDEITRIKTNSAATETVEVKVSSSIKKAIDSNKKSYEDYNSKIKANKEKIKEYQKEISEYEKNNPLVVTASKNGQSPIFNTFEDKEEYIKYQLAQQAIKGMTDENKKYSESQKKNKENLKEQAKVYENLLSDTELQANLSEEQINKLKEALIEIYSITDPNKVKGMRFDNILTSGDFSDAVKELLNFKDAGEVTAEQVDELREKFPEFNDALGDISSEEAAEQMNSLSKEVQNNVKIINDNAQSIQNKLSAIASSFDILNSAVSEYNESGYITASTLKSLMDNNLVQYLQFTTDGVIMNADALYQMEAAAKDAQLATWQLAAAEDIHKLALGDTTNVSSIAKTALENLKTKTEQTGYSALNAAGKLALFNNELKRQKEIEKGNLNPDVVDPAEFEKQADAVIATYQKYATALVYTSSKAKSASVSSRGSGSSKSPSSSSKSEKEWWETELEKLQNQFKYNEITIEEYIRGLDNLLGRVQKGTDAWRKINEELQKQRLTKIEDDYKRGSISLDEYIKKLKELIKAYKRGTDAWNELADKIKKGLQDKADKQKDDLATAEDAAVGIIDEEIEKLNKLKEEQEEYYDQLIADKEKANEETEKELELARLQEALANAQKEKTKRVWREGIGWVWEADQEAIREAQEALDEFNNEQEIDALEKQKEEAISAIEEQIDAWEKYKESWEDVANDYETQQARIILAQQLGANAEAAILQQRLDVLEQYKSKYLATMAEIEKLENTPADKLSGYSTPTSTNVSSGGSSGSSGSSSKTYKVKSGDTLSGIGSKYGVSWQKIYNANKSVIGSNPNRIYPGQTLTIPGYANGGMVDYTGLAMLHGTKSKPEFVLNNDQMRNMLSTLTRPQTTSNLPTNSGSVNNYNFGNIELPNVTNAKQFVTELKSLVNITKHQ